MRYKFDKNNRIYPFRRLFSQCRNNSFKNSNDYSRKNRREQALLARILIANHASHFHYIPSNDIYIWMEKFGARNRWNSETLLKGHAIHPQLRKKKKIMEKWERSKKSQKNSLGNDRYCSLFFSASFGLLFAIIGPTNDLRVVSWSSLHRGADIATVSKER